MTALTSRRCAAFVTAVLAACGGDERGARDVSAESISDSNDEVPSGRRFVVGGTIVGLEGTGLVLQNGGGDDLEVPAGAEAFAFATSVAAGSYYVQAQPRAPDQTCAVAKGSETPTPM